MYGESPDQSDIGKTSVVNWCEWQTQLNTEGWLYADLLRTSQTVWRSGKGVQRIAENLLLPDFLQSSTFLYASTSNWFQIYGVLHILFPQCLHACEILLKSLKTFLLLITCFSENSSQFSADILLTVRLPWYYPQNFTHLSDYIIWYSGSQEED